MPPPEPGNSAFNEYLLKPKEGCARLLRFSAPEHTGIHQTTEPGYRRMKVDTSAVTAPTKAEDIDNKAWFPARTVFDDSIAVRRRIDTDLSFESRFESGNLQRAVRTSEFEYNLTLRADVNTGKAQWFYFLVQRMQRGVPYKFNIINFYKDKSTYNIGLQPLLWSSEDACQNNIGWRRSGTEISYYENGLKQENGANYFTLSFKLMFPHTNDTCYVCMCYPYTYTDLQRHLRGFEGNVCTSKYLIRSELCKTLAGNVCDLLQIANPESLIPVKARKAFVLTSRVHPGESNASFIMKGVLDFLLSTDRVAVALRNNFVFYIVPMLNPDGVINGFYRGSLSGDDLNRQWSEPSKKQHSTIYYCKQLIKKLVKDERLLLFCDFHGHSTKRNVFMYGCPAVENGNSLFVPKDMPRKETEFPKLFSKRCRHFSFKDCKFEADKGKDNSGRVIIFREFGIVHSFTLEASLFGREIDGNLIHFSQKDLEEIGSEFCRCLSDYATQNESWGIGENTISELLAALKNDNPGPGAAVLDSYLKSLKFIRDRRSILEINSDTVESTVITEKDSFCQELEESIDPVATSQHSCLRPATLICSHENSRDNNSRPVNRSKSPNPSEAERMGSFSHNLFPKTAFDSLTNGPTMRLVLNGTRDTEGKMLSQSKVAKLCTSFGFEGLLKNSARTQGPAEETPLKQLQRPDINYQLWRSIRNATRRAPTLPLLSAFSKDSRASAPEDQQKATRPPSNEISAAAAEEEISEGTTCSLKLLNHPLAMLLAQDRVRSRSEEDFSDLKDSDDITKSWQSNSTQSDSPWTGCMPVESDAASLRVASQTSGGMETKRAYMSDCDAAKGSDILTSASARSSRISAETAESLTLWPYCQKNENDLSSQRRAGMSLTHRRKTRDSGRDDIGIQKGVFITFLRRRK